MAQHTAVIGAAGVMGRELVAIMEERGFPCGELVLLDHKQACGESLTFCGQDIVVDDIEGFDFSTVDLCLCAVSEELAGKYVPLAVNAGAVVIDLSGRFTLLDGVPLVVPEINPEAVSRHKGIIASPQSMSVALALALGPIHRLGNISRVVVSTYQAVSECGQRAMDELTSQISALLSFQDPPVRVFPHQIAFNALPQCDRFEEDGSTRLETRIAGELGKILDAPQLRVHANAVRVPVFYGHAAAVNLETQACLLADEVRGLLESAPGLRIEDNPGEGLYPTPVFSAGEDVCCVGRIREDRSTANGIALWLACDNMRKGAALNAVQIAELLEAQA